MTNTARQAPESITGDWGLFNQPPAAQPTYSPYPFQRDAVEATFQAWTKGLFASLVEAPTGSGKSIILAEVCRRYLEVNPNARIIKAVHRSELVKQNSEKIADMTGREVGIYSAGLRQKRLDCAITCANVQSIARVKQWPYADLLIVDEAHRVPPLNGRSNQYHKLIDGLREKNEYLQMFGLTATPYRLLDGPLWNPQTGRGSPLFDDRVYRIDIPPLVADGKLAPVRYKTGKIQLDTSQLKRKDTGDFDTEQQAEWIAEQIDGLIGNILEQGADRDKWLVFMPSVRSAEAMYHALINANIKTSIVTGNSLGRDHAFDDFKTGDTRALVGCEVFTEGFDAPQVDFVVLCRATESVSLYVQIVGRGTRYFGDKADCLVLDFGRNVARHGMIEEAFDWGVPKGGRREKKGQSPKTKDCPKCLECVPIQTRECPCCGHSFALDKLRVVKGQTRIKGVVQLEVLDGPIARVHTSGNWRQIIRLDFTVRDHQDRSFVVSIYGSPRIAWESHPLALQWRDRQRELLNAGAKVNGRTGDINAIIASSQDWPRAKMLTAREPNPLVGRPLYEIIKVEYDNA